MQIYSSFLKNIEIMTLPTTMNTAGCSRKKKPERFIVFVTILFFPLYLKSQLFISLAQLRQKMSLHKDSYQVSGFGTQSLTHILFFLQKRKVLIWKRYSLSATIQVFGIVLDYFVFILMTIFCILLPLRLDDTIKSSYYLIFLPLFIVILLGLVFISVGERFFDRNKYKHLHKNLLYFVVFQEDQAKDAPYSSFLSILNTFQNMPTSRGMSWVYKKTRERMKRFLFFFSVNTSI